MRRWQCFSCWQVWLRWVPRRCVARNRPAWCPLDCATLGLSLCFFVTAGPFSRCDLAQLGAPLGVLVAALIYACIRGTNPIRVAVLAGIGLVNAGVLWMAEQVWNPWFASHGQPHSYLPLLVFLMAPLTVGPLVGLAGRRLRRVIERAKQVLAGATLRLPRFCQRPPNSDGRRLSLLESARCNSTRLIAQFDGSTQMG